MSNANRPEGYPETPELDKLRGVKDQSQTVGGFLEWVHDNHWKLVTFRGNDVGLSIEQLLAHYFKIDLAKVSAEKDAIVEWQYRQNEARASTQTGASSEDRTHPT